MKELSKEEQCCEKCRYIHFNNNSHEFSPSCSCPCHTPQEEKKDCLRCGIPKSEWKGRWEKPICKVGGTSYDQHILEEKNSWVKELMKLIFGTEHKLPNQTFIALESFIKQEKEKSRADLIKELAQDLKEIMNKCKTERGLGTALGNYVLKLLEDKSK